MIQSRLPRWPDRETALAMKRAEQTDSATSIPEPPDWAARDYVLKDRGGVMMYMAPPSAVDGPNTMLPETAARLGRTGHEHQYEYRDFRLGYELTRKALDEALFADFDKPLPPPSLLHRFTRWLRSLVQ